MAVEILKKIGLVLLGIASAVNDISFGQQIVEWFGTATEIGEPVEDVVETASMFIVG